MKISNINSLPSKHFIGKKLYIKSHLKQNNWYVYMLWSHILASPLSEKLKIYSLTKIEEKIISYEFSMHCRHHLRVYLQFTYSRFPCK